MVEGESQFEEVKSRTTGKGYTSSMQGLSQTLARLSSEVGKQVRLLPLLRALEAGKGRHAELTERLRDANAGRGCAELTE